MSQAQNARSGRGRLADGVVDRVRERAAEGIVDIVSDVVALKRSGSGSFKGLCPFHDERTPSFHVNTVTGRYHCFGCDADGDGIAFVQETNGGEFRWAVEYLAEKYGIPIETSQADTDNRGRLRNAIQVAREFFSAHLLDTPKGHPARQLLEDRGFDVEHSATTFGCGYAPESATSLLNHLKGRRFTTDEIVAAGLARVGEDSQRPWDFFRNRLLWPITTQMGQTVGFGARRLDPNDRLPAKFINTPETDLYKKSQALFGITEARRAISKTGRAIVVEGYTDVMAMHLAGVTTAVASCGTAFTSDHLAILRRLVGEGGEITFALDDDNAGITATMRVYDLARDSVKRLTVMPPSDGKDPDEYRQAHGDTALAALVEKRTPLIGTVIQNTITSGPLESIEDRVVALDRVKPLFEHIKDPILRSQYAQQVADLLHLDASAVEQRLRGNATDSGRDTLSSTAEKLDHDDGAARPDLAASIERDVCACLVQSEAASRAYALEALWGLSLNASKSIVETVLAAMQAEARGTWFSRLEANAPNDSVKRNLSMLASLPLGLSAEVLPEHANELLDRREDERERQRRQLLEDEFKAASPERKLDLLKRMEGLGH